MSSDTFDAETKCDDDPKRNDHLSKWVILRVDGEEDVAALNRAGYHVNREISVKIKSYLKEPAVKMRRDDGAEPAEKVREIHDVAAQICDGRCRWKGQKVGEPGYVMRGLTFSAELCNSCSIM